MSFYRMHRGWMENGMFPSVIREPFCHRAAWLWLIEHAAHKDNGKLMRGQLCHSLRHLAREWGWETTRVLRFFRALVEHNAITTANATAGTVVTICNYDKYQSSPEASATPDDGRPQRDRNATATTKNKEEGSKEEDLVPDGTRQSARQITEWMVEVWKEVFGEALSTPARHNENRIRAARARFVGDFRSDIGEWRKYLERIHRCPWLMGNKAKDGWRADFDWVLKPTNLTKVLEGRYDNHANGSAIANGNRLDDAGLHLGPTEPPPTLEGIEFPMDRPH